MLKPTALALTAALLVLCACSPKATPPLPTEFRLDTLPVTPIPPTAEPSATSAAPELPPTFTPTLPPSPIPTDPALAPTQTPEGFNEFGSIYYIFNSDSIAALVADGSHEELIAVGGPYTELVAAPDGSLLAFVAPGAGSGREVYVMSRDGTYTQKVSCLGMASITDVAWSPDSKALAWVAAPTIGAPADIYTATVEGSGNCPVDNRQGMIVPLGSTWAADPEWNNTMDKFFYSNYGVFGLDLVNNQTYTLSEPSGFGPDYSLAHNPAMPLLAYLHTVNEEGKIGGQLYFLDTDSIDTAPIEQPAGRYFARTLRWSADGRYLIVALDAGVIVYDAQARTSLTIDETLTFPPFPALSPNNRQIAYVNVNPVNPAIAQIFVADLTSGSPKQVTFHTEGTITDLLWLESP